MRRLIYTIIAILLVVTLYILVMKTGPEKTPANAGVIESVYAYSHIGGVGTGDQSRPALAQQQATTELLKKTIESTGATLINSKPANSPLATGTFSGYLSYDEAEAILAGIFSDLEAEKVQKMQDGNLISWGGYSPKITQFLRDLTGEPINIQCALRYNSTEDHTYLHLGSPIIYMEY